MKAKKLKDVIDIIDGRVVDPAGIKENYSVSQVCQDSRLASDADLFFAVRGDRFDGQDFLAEVLESGCRILVVEDFNLAQRFSESNPEAELIYVENTVRALQKLAKNYLNEVSPKVIAITGSVGKTTTRDLCHAIISVKYRAHKNRSNFNTEVGVPLMILEMPEDTEVCILEMGMDHFGEISAMVELAEPDVALITNIGTQHYDALGSVENIFKAKMEIVEGMDSSNLLITGRDESYLTSARIGEVLKQKCKSGLPLHWFAVADSVVTGDGGIKFDVEISDDEGNAVSLDEEPHFKIPIPGRHNAQNAALAVASAIQLGVKADDIQKGLDTVEMTEQRLDMEEVSGVLFIDDSYNAGPASMRAGLDVLAEQECGEGGRRIAVLGTMLSLDDIAKQEHEKVLDYAIRKADKVFAFDFPCEHDSPIVEFYDDKEALKKRIISELRTGDRALFKASNAKGFGQLVKEVKEELDR